MTKFQKRIREEMERKGLKQADLARLTGLRTGTISKYLNIPDRRIDARILLEISKALDVNPEWLYGVTDTKKTFFEPSIIDVYAQLSETGKEALADYAKYLFEKEQKK